MRAAVYQPRKLAKIRQHVHELHQKMPFYQISLKPGHIAPLKDLPPSPWSGVPALGKDILQGQFTFYDQKKSLPSIWQVSTEDDAFYAYLHCFEWLYHLREVGGSSSRRLARALISSWIDLYAEWDKSCWNEQLLSRRLINILGLYEFYGASADDDFKISLAYTVKKQFIHLKKIIQTAVAPQAESVIALLMTSFGLQDTPTEERLNWLRLLEQLLSKNVSPYGFLPAPTAFKQQLFLFQNLLYLRICLNSTKTPIPAQLQGTLHRLAHGLRLIFIGGKKLVEEDLSPFEKNVLTASLSKIPGKSTPYTFVKEESFLRTPIGKSTFHAHCRDVTTIQLSSGQEPLFCLRTEPFLKKATLIPTLMAKWSSQNLLLNQSMTYSNAKQEAIHTRQLYINEDASDIRAHETLIGEGGTTITFWFILGSQVTKVTPLEKEGGLLISSLKMGAWLLKISGATQVSIATEKRATLLGDRHPQYKVKMRTPLTAGGYRLKWSLKLLT